MWVHFTSMGFSRLCPVFTYSVSFHFLPALIVGGFLPHIMVLLITPRGPEIEGAQRGSSDSQGKVWWRDYCRNMTEVQEKKTRANWTHFFPKEKWNQKYFSRCFQTCIKSPDIFQNFSCKPFSKTSEWAHSCFGNWKNTRKLKHYFPQRDIYIIADLLHVLPRRHPSSEWFRRCSCCCEHVWCRQSPVAFFTC